MANGGDSQATDGRVQPVIDELIGRHMLREVDIANPIHARLWRDSDLASMLEGCFHDTLDPTDFSDRTRADALTRLEPFWHPLRLSDPRLGPRFFLLSDGEIAGTVQLGIPIGGRFLRISSLYTRPDYRGSGVAGRFMTALFEAAARRLLWVRLSAYWTWTDALRFYRRMGMWAWGWKHSVDLVWARALPDLQVRFSEDDSAADDTATLSLRRDDEQLAFLRAHRVGEGSEQRLRIDELEPMRAARIAQIDSLITTHVIATLSLDLALAGWPLIRSADDWAKRHFWSDIGQPEGLAYKIQVFEEIARDHGQVVRTPSIPGVTESSG